MSNPTEQEIRAFVGPKADYYLQKWRLALDGTGSPTGLNWAAFFFSGLWLAFRKMYRAAAILGGIVLLESVMERLGILGRPAAAVAFGRSMALGAALACCGFGNPWYFSHARKAIAVTRSLGLTEEEHLQQLAKRGGVSYLSSVLFLVVVFVAAGGLELLFWAAGLYP